MTHSPAPPWPDVPGRLRVPASVQRLAIAAAVVGLVALMWTFGRGDLELAWSAYLIGAFFTLGLGVFGVAWLAILYLAGATWSVTMRRIPEAMTAWLLPGAVLIMAILPGVPTLYEWSHPGAGDELLAHKAPFLNVTMFATLVGASLVSWIAFAAAIVRASYRQDSEGGMRSTALSRTMSAIYLVVFAITLSIVSFYLLLSLDAHWFSTMFAVLVFTDVVQTGTAFVAVVASVIVMSGALKGFLGENHLHSLGKMVFASTGFWAYIYFCQFMLIWYANIPEETAYFIRRWENGWLFYLLALPLLKFVIPFLLMIPRAAKRRPSSLMAISAVIMFAQFWELYVMVGPALGAAGASAPAHVPIIELLVTVGFAGMFLLTFAWAIGRRNAVPLKDPQLAACLNYHS